MLYSEVKYHGRGYVLVSDPLPEPKSRRPRSMMGNMALVPLKNAPNAKVEDPSTHREENRNTPTGAEISMCIWW